jgi:hypothetical protein
MPSRQPSKESLKWAPVQSAVCCRPVWSCRSPPCSSETSSQPFLPWADPSDYTLVPGGDFAAGAPAWTLSGGAQVVAGNDGYNVNGDTAAQSLSLPDGSSATSPSMCVSVNDPDLRFFAINTGNPNDTLQVSVEFENSYGMILSVPIGQFAATGTWEPTVVDPIAANMLALLPGNNTAVAFQFTPQGSGGNWSIDNVYVDPWERG